MTDQTPEDMFGTDGAVPSRRSSFATPSRALVVISPVIDH